MGSGRESIHGLTRTFTIHGLTPADMKRPLLEVIVQTLADAREAARGGADRLEVVRALEDGGLTPPLALVQEIAAEVSLPLRVMVRENAGYSTDASASGRRSGARPRHSPKRASTASSSDSRDAGELELDHVADVLTQRRTST